MASEKVTALIEEIKELTVIELADLVSALEEEFGVSAQAPVAVAAAGAPAAAAGATAEENPNSTLSSNPPAKKKLRSSKSLKTLPASA